MAAQREDPMRFDDRVVVISGAGRGVGRAHALAFAARGATVVVNDLGGAADGSADLPGADGREPVAAQVAREIVEAGGTAVADTSDVAAGNGAATIVGRALDEFGRIDVVVANAGIDTTVRLRDVTPDLMRRFFDVHVLGTHQLIAAAWPSMVDQGYGRVITTTSAAGYFGLAWALPYATAKAALHGLTQTLALEGLRHGITVNAVAPFAASRLATARTRAVPELSAAIDRRAPASAVTPMVLWLAHETTTVTGTAFEVGGGAVSRLVVAHTPGLRVEADVLTPELLRRRSDSLMTVDEAVVPELGAVRRPVADWVVAPDAFGPGV